MSDILSLTRGMWHVLEPLHASLYYAPEATEEAAYLGYAVDTRWPSYFAWRSAPLGTAGPNLVAAAFYSFSPRFVAEHVPSVWRVAAPDRVSETRLLAVDRSFRALFVDGVISTELLEAAALAREAADAAITAGRPMAAANADLPWPREPHLQLWHAATILREHRGDGHITSLIGAGLDPCEALVSFAATGAAPVEAFASRGWSEEEWTAARDRLLDRGWIDDSGTATPAGVKGREAVEEHTDELASAPWMALGLDSCGRLAQLLAPFTMIVAASGMLPQRSTLGIPVGGRAKASRSRSAR